MVLICVIEGFNALHAKVMISNYWVIELAEVCKQSWWCLSCFSYNWRSF